MLVNEQRKKLSKRQDPVAVESYRDQGFLPEAFRNYLALLGWSPPGDEEKVDVETLVGEFRLEDVHHAPAFFDVQKLTHLNGEYIRELPVDEFVARSRPWVAPEPGSGPRPRSGRRRGRPSGSTRPPSPRSRRWSKSGWPGSTRCRGWSTSSSWPSRRSTPAAGRRRSRGTSGAAAILAAAARRYGRATGRPRPSGRRRMARGRGGGPQAGQGAGADPGGRHRPDGRATPLRVAGVLGRDEVLRRLAGRPRRGRRDGRHRLGAGRPDAASARSAWRSRSSACSSLAIVVYFAVTLVQVWLTSRHYDPQPAQAIVVMGAAQYNGVPSPTCGPGSTRRSSSSSRATPHLVAVTGQQGER